MEQLLKESGYDTFRVFKRNISARNAINDFAIDWLRNEARSFSHSSKFTNTKPKTIAITARHYFRAVCDLGA